MEINGYSDPTGNVATAKAEKTLGVPLSARYRKGIQICKEVGCTRIVQGRCFGWDDPLYMWKHYGECPHFSDDWKLIFKIDDACGKYAERRNGLIG